MQEELNKALSIKLSEFTINWKEYKERAQTNKRGTKAAWYRTLLSGRSLRRELHLYLQKLAELEH